MSDQGDRSERRGALEEDPIPELFERLRAEAPDSIKKRARELATAFVGKGEGLPLAPGDVAGPYEILSILGAGGQAVVYLAEHQQLKRKVALKVPRRDVGDRLMREARLVAELAHSSIVQVVDLSLDGPVSYLVLEHCSGGSLEDRLDIVAPDGLPLEQVRAIAVSVLEALAFAHERGVVHRDVKPANILFDASNHAKVADFGIGTIADANQLSVSHDLSKLSLLAGTPLYLAPEQENPALRVEGQLDGRADLFSFGKVLFQMLTGASPRTIRPPSRLVPGLDPAWDDYVFKLTEERPERRFENAREALEDLPPLSRKVPPVTLPTPEDGLGIARYRSKELTVEPSGTMLYEAVHVLTEQPVLVRILSAEESANPRFVERFLREAQAAAKVTHRNVIRVLDSGMTQTGRPYIVYEKVGGRTLEEVLADTGRQPWQHALRVVGQVAEALDAIHGAGLHHRSLNAQNIFIDADGKVRIGDIGPDPSPAYSGMKLTASGAMTGVPLYLAPEIGRVKEVDGRADIYSLGLVLYYLVSGEEPMRRFNAIEILSARAHRRIPPPQDVVLPDAVRRVLGKMLEPEREQRYPTARELSDDMARAFRGEAVLAGEPSLWTAPKPFSPEPARKVTVKPALRARLLVAIMLVVALAGSIMFATTTDLPTMGILVVICTFAAPVGFLAVWLLSGPPSR